MSLYHIKGNLFDSQADIICHQCNCKGVMGSGVAKEVKVRYPHVYEAYHKDYLDGKLKLGYVCFAKANSDQIIANICGQDAYGWNGQFTDYNALSEGLLEVRKYMQDHKMHSLALPYKMSCIRGGGSWDVVLDIILDIFGNNFDIEIWHLS